MALEQFNAKVYPESLKLFNELMEESGSQTRGKFIDLLLENYQNPRKVIGTNEVEQAMINDLKQQIEILSNRGMDLDEKNIQLESDCINLKEAYQKLLNEHDNLNVLNAGMRLNENQVIITLEPHVKFFVDLTLEAYLKRGKPTTAGAMLLNLFWNYIYRGAGDYLPVLFPSEYVRSVLERFKKEQKLKLEAATDGHE